MIYWLIIFIIFLLSFCLEQSILANFLSPQFVPHIILVLVVFFSFKRNLREIWKELFLSAIMADIFYFSYFGVNFLSFIFIVLFVSYLSRRFLSVHGKTKLLALFTIAFVAFVAYDALVFAIDNFYRYLKDSQEFLLSSFYWKEILKTSLIETILLAILYPLLLKAEKIRFKEKIVPSIK